MPGKQEVEAVWLSLVAWVALDPVVGGVPQPTEMVPHPQDVARAYVLSRTGEIWEVDLEQGTRTLWAHLGDRITTRGLEQGLLGMAFAPWTDAVWVNYTDREGHTVVARIPLQEGRPQVSRLQVVLRIPQPAANHNGGCIRFGPDGMLYIGTGDGGRAGDPWGNAQNLEVLLGKILRLDVRQVPYRIPPDNPLKDGEGRREIWLWGLRNPWKFSFDRKTGDLWIADVGQDRWEEINRIPAGVGGKNLGWNNREGRHPFRGASESTPDLWDPVWEYDHREGCSVTGGFVYRGRAIPDLYGWYVFGDFCSGKIWALCADCDTLRVRLLKDTQLRISSFGEDGAGELYVLDFARGVVYRLVPSPLPSSR